jgi:hypothetical protein
MRDERPPAVYDWGHAPPMAPTVRRAAPLDWLRASAFLGALAGALMLLMLWRELPGLPAPEGSLGQHMAMWFKTLARLVAPDAFAQDARRYAAFWAQLPTEGRVAIIWRSCVGAMVATIPGFLLLSSYMEPRDALIHIRGSMRHEGARAIGRLRAMLAPAAKERPDHEIAPGLAYPAGMWERQVLVVGGTGSGKSTALKPLIEKVLAAKERAILFDPKGEFTMGFKGPAIVAPWDRRSFAWDIAKDLRNKGEIRRFAAAMIQESQDPMWAYASRQLLVGFVIYLKRTMGDRWGWRELADQFSKTQKSMLAMMEKCNPEAIRAVERASVTTQGILINLSSFCAPIFDLAEAWGDAPESRRISFVEWTLGKSRQTQVVLQGHGSYAELSKCYVRGIVEVVAAIVNSVEMLDDPKRKLWVICDEFPQMGKVPIRALMEVGRSRGVRCVLACQDFAQLEEIHGPLMLKALVSLCGTLLIGQMMQGDTADQLAKALGTREVERPNLSSSHRGVGGSDHSTTMSFSRDELAIYKPSELASRLGPTPDGKGVVMALVTGGQAYELFWPRYEMKRLRQPYVPAEWTLGVGLFDETEDKSPSAAQLPPDGPARSPFEPGGDASPSPRAPAIGVGVGVGVPRRAAPADGAPADVEETRLTDAPRQVAHADGVNVSEARAEGVDAGAESIGEELIGRMLRDSLMGAAGSAMFASETEARSEIEDGAQECSRRFESEKDESGV